MGPKRSKKSTAGVASSGSQALPIFNYFSPLAEAQASAAPAGEGRAPSWPRVAPERGAGTPLNPDSAPTLMPRHSTAPSDLLPHSTGGVQQLNSHGEAGDGAPLTTTASSSTAAAVQGTLLQARSQSINPLQAAILSPTTPITGFLGSQSSVPSQATGVIYSQPATMAVSSGVTHSLPAIPAASTGHQVMVPQKGSGHGQGSQLLDGPVVPLSYAPLTHQQHLRPPRVASQDPSLSFHRRTEPAHPSSPLLLGDPNDSDHWAAEGFHEPPSPLPVSAGQQESALSPTPTPSWTSSPGASS